ncbi:DUF4167 domain-containing protein [Mesorhizobium sp. KR9-304]|uniref:DUF4167 domain-containing protein n=1 Tax=Mesorhizobium sp. KR9-304 TaxID=3156614 RepID=UPI0032B5A91C
MRPQQQNRRMRGRSGGGGNNPNQNQNQNRKGPNPLTRNYESNGPDVKIRGSAQQIAEKYAQLARDAHSSGDRVMSENYLQHAEHYNRIIAAAQAQMPIQNMQNQRDGSDDDMDEDRDEFGNTNNANQGNANQGNANQGNANQGNVGQGNVGQSNAGQGNYQGNPAQDLNSQDNGGEFVQLEQPNLGSGPQPVIEGIPAEVALNPEASEGSPSRERNLNGNGHGAASDGRRNRRPRRGERSRPDTNEDDEPAADGLVATLSRGAPVSPEPMPQEPAADTKADGGAALIDADS